jgi:hypothetical protein
VSLYRSFGRSQDRESAGETGNRSAAPVRICAAPAPSSALAMAYRWYALCVSPLARELTCYETRAARQRDLPRRGVPMTILRARETQYFLYLFVRCTCGCRFGHRADRRVVVCYVCGRVADLGRVKTKEQAKRKVLADRRRRLRAARETLVAGAHANGNGHAHANGHVHGNGHAHGAPVRTRGAGRTASARVTAPRRSSSRRAL